MLTPKRLGKRALERRHSLGLTQDAVAAAASVSTETVRRFELGLINPNIATFLKIASGLQTSGASLLAEQVSDEVTELVLGLPTHEQEIAFVMLRALSDYTAARR